MKRIILMALATMLVFASCSKDENKDEKGVTGRWECTFSHVRYTYAGEVVQDDTNHWAGNTLELLANASYSENGNEMGTFLFDNNEITFQNTQNAAEFSGKYQIEKHEDSLLRLEYYHSQADRRMTKTYEFTLL